MRRQNQISKLPFHFSKIGRYWDKKSEIDLVAFDQKGNVIFGECKWKKEAMGIKELNTLREKALGIEEDFISKHYYLFSKSGFDKELISLSELDKSVNLISLDEICCS